MDLKNGKVTIGELMRNQQATALFEKEFPGVLHSPLAGMMRNKTLSQVLRMAAGRVPQQKIERVLEQLRKL